MPSAHPAPAFPRSPQEAASLDVGAQWLCGTSPTGASLAVWLEQTPREWLGAFFVAGAPELGCAWRRRPSGAFGELLALWGGDAARKIQSAEMTADERSEAAFLSLRAHADALSPSGMAPGWVWRQAQALRDMPESILRDEQERGIVRDLGALLALRPGWGRPPKPMAQGKAR
jgi:hypothetical protein